MEKTLCLYVEQGYIAGAVAAEGSVRQLRLPCGEAARVALFFHADPVTGEISYANGYEQPYRDKEPHYYGDVLTAITSPGASFYCYGVKYPLREIFAKAHVFEHLKQDVGEEDKVPTLIAFSPNVTPGAQVVLLDVVEAAGFEVRGSTVSIERLALEHAARQGMPRTPGYRLTLSATGTALHYALYHDDGHRFTLRGDGTLPGLGSDLRPRALAQCVVERINNTARLLPTADEHEREVQRLMCHTDGWLRRLDASRPLAPVQIAGVTLSIDTRQDYDVPVSCREIDERTQAMVRGITDEVASFVERNRVPGEELRGVLMIGPTFANTQFREQLLKRYALAPADLTLYGDADLTAILGTYPLLDLKRAHGDREKQIKLGKDEVQRKQEEEAKAEARRKAKKEQEKREAKEREAKERDAKWLKAKAQGFDCERRHDYDGMAEHFAEALGYKPDDEETQLKHAEALELRAKAAVAMKAYREKIAEAQRAFNDSNWERARQSASEALTYKPDSSEARRLLDDAKQRLSHATDLARFLDRADTLIAAGQYAAARNPLAKARLLGIGDIEIRQREKRIEAARQEAEQRLRDMARKADVAAAAGRYDEAVAIFTNLATTDAANAAKWNARLADVKSRQDEAARREEQFRQLKADVNSAYFAEQWQRVAELCQKALTIKDDFTLQAKLCEAQREMEKESAKREIDDTLAKAETLIKRRRIEEAHSLLNVLSRHTLSVSQKAKMRQLRANLFRMEEQPAPRQHKTVTPDDFNF